MKNELREIISKTIKILEVREKRDIKELKEVSDQAVEGVALHKDLDLISITVLVYSIYKIAEQIPEEDYKDILAELKSAKRQLEQNNLGRYNRSVKILYGITKKCNAKVKEHLQDVMEAAKVKKGMVLLQKGLSIGQAAGLMGLSNWDLQKYAGTTTALDHHREKVKAETRIKLALEVFGIK